jgi:hypothetical protein
VGTGRWRRLDPAAAGDLQTTPWVRYLFAADDLERFVFLLGGSDGEPLFGHPPS